MSVFPMRTPHGRGFNEVRVGATGPVLSAAVGLGVGIPPGDGKCGVGSLTESSGTEFTINDSLLRTQQSIAHAMKYHGSLEVQTLGQRTLGINHQLTLAQLPGRFSHIDLTIARPLGCRSVLIDIHNVACAIRPEGPVPGTGRPIVIVIDRQPIAHQLPLGVIELPRPVPGTCYEKQDSSRQQ